MRFVKLALVLLLGFALYEFLRGVAGSGKPAARAKRPQSFQPRQPSIAENPAGEAGVAGLKGPGQPLVTHDPDGASVRHRVGRGVVTR